MGNIGSDHIVFTDQPGAPVVTFNEQPDFGTMGLALLKEESQIANRKSQIGLDLASTALPEANVLSGLFLVSDRLSDAPATKPFGEKLVGSLTRKLELGPGESATITFAILWHFPNITLGGLSNQQGRWYGKKFTDALAVAQYLAEHFQRLATQTFLWRDTWYDSTLPHWFLDRTFLNASILATNTCYWFGNGRFYAWEVVGCCAGTCTHVLALRPRGGPPVPASGAPCGETVDFGVAFEPDTGAFASTRA